jgi:hypothetical protein
MTTSAVQRLYNQQLVMPPFTPPAEIVTWLGAMQAQEYQLAKAYMVSSRIDGTEYWHGAAMPDERPPLPPLAYLLPPLDEYGIGYRDHSASLDAQYVEQARNAKFGGTILVNRQMLGNWRRTLSKKSVLVKIAPFRPFTSEERELVAAAADRFGAFLGVPAVVQA